MFSWISSIAIFFSALCGEIFGNIFGGGSFFIQPVLLLAGVTPHIAIANDVASAGISAITFVWLTRKQGYVNWDVFRWMAPGALIGAIFGVNLMKEIPASILQWLLVIICITGTGFLIRRLFVSSSNIAALEGKSDTFAYCKNWQLVSVLSAVCLGIYDGISGAGSGVLLIIVLALIFNARFKVAATTAAAVGSVSLLSAGATSMYQGLLDIHVMMLLVPAGILASFISKWIVGKLSDRTLLMIFIGVVSITLCALIRDMLVA